MPLRSAGGAQRSASQRVPTQPPGCAGVTRRNAGAGGGAGWTRKAMPAAPRSESQPELGPSVSWTRTRQWYARPSRRPVRCTSPRTGEPRWLTAAPVAVGCPVNG